VDYIIETEQELDGRWIAEITNMPGVLCHGDTKEEAIAQVKEFALLVEEQLLG
jgi:predicted RNase H-like HicB family nuclease